MLGAGISALCSGKNVLPEHLQLASALFEAVGRTVVVDEKHMDAVTGLSASGPAYIYIILEALAEAGVTLPVLQLGLPDAFIDHGDQAALLAGLGLDAAGIERAIRARFGALLA